MCGAQAFPSHSSRASAQAGASCFRLLERSGMRIFGSAGGRGSHPLRLEAAWISSHAGPSFCVAAFIAIFVAVFRICEHREANARVFQR